MNYFVSRGEYLYKLYSPYRKNYYLPLDAATLADNLGIAYRSALKVCKGQRVLKKSELLALQVLHFGLIADAEFLRYGFFVKEGKLYSTKLDNYELSSGELLEYTLLKNQVSLLKSELDIANAKLNALLEQDKKPSAKVISFSDYLR